MPWPFTPAPPAPPVPAPGQTQTNGSWGGQNQGLRIQLGMGAPPKPQGFADGESNVQPLFKGLPPAGTPFPPQAPAPAGSVQPVSTVAQGVRNLLTAPAAGDVTAARQAAAAPLPPSAPLPPATPPAPATTGQPTPPAPQGGMMGRGMPQTGLPSMNSEPAAPSPAAKAIGSVLPALSPVDLQHIAAFLPRQPMPQERIMNDVYNQANAQRDADLADALQKAGGDIHSQAYQQAHMNALARYNAALRPLLYPQFGMLEALSGTEPQTR